MWILLGIVSSVFLGFYDVSKKHALRENAVIPILFLSTVAGAACMIPIVLCSALAESKARLWGVFIPAIGPGDHLHILAKAAIVAASWIFAYFGFKHLPISIVSPIRASGPVFTLIGAVFLFGEMPSTAQWVGLALIIFSYWTFSLIGTKEGIRFHTDKWVGFIFLSTFIGTFSALYDKYLIQRLGIEPMAVQVWYFAYLVLILGLVFLVFWWPKRTRYTPLNWRWTVPAIGFFLTVSDFVYFRALTYPGAMIVLLSAVRRSNVLVSFFLGGRIFKDVNLVPKALALAGVLAGVLCIVLSVR
jgi:bacterial/archaeal transporter family protein